MLVKCIDRLIIYMCNFSFIVLFDRMSKVSSFNKIVSLIKCSMEILKIITDF